MWPEVAGYDPENGSFGPVQPTRPNASIAEELQTIALCLRAFKLEGIAQRLEELAAKLIAQ